MEAGRELDALVAEKVMGLNVSWDKNTPCPYCGSEMRYCGTRSWCFAECHEWRYGPYKEYSTDITAVWEVHCEMREESFSLRRVYAQALREMESERLRDRTTVNPPLPDDAMIAWPDAVLFLEPVDFCLAALKAKGIEVE